MHRLALVALAVVAAGATSHAEPAPRRAFVDVAAGAGAMAEAPGDAAGIVSLGVRAGWWVPRSRFGLEVGADVASVHPLSIDDDFDTLHHENTRARRHRLMAGLRVTSDPARRTVYVGRAAIAIEHVGLSTTEVSDWWGTSTDHAGGDVGPAFELSGGFLVKGDAWYGLEAALTAASHDGAPVGSYQMTYQALEVELRFVLGFDL